MGNFQFETRIQIHLWVFFTALKNLWEELEAYLTTDVCACPHRCVCTTGVSNARHHHDITRSIRFLTGFNDQFDMVHVHILLMIPLPPINYTFSMVLQQERQHNALHIDESNVLVNASDTRKFQGKGHGSGGFPSSFGLGYKSKECSHYGWVGHKIDTCYKKHGFPPNYGKSYSTNNIFLENADVRDDVDDSNSTKQNDSYSFT